MSMEGDREISPEQAAAAGAGQAWQGVIAQLTAKIEQAGVRFGQLQAAAKQQETSFKSTIAELENDIKYLHEQLSEYRDVIAERDDELYALRKEHGVLVEPIGPQTLDEVEWPVDANGSPVEEETT